MADQPQNLPNPLNVCPYHAGEVARVNRVEAVLANIQLETHAIRTALLGDLEGGGGGMISHLRTIETEQHELREQVRKISGLLTGNGQPGLDERVRNLEAVRTRNDRLSWMLISAVIIQGVVLLKGYIVHLGG